MSQICTDCFHASLGDVTGNSETWDRETWEKNSAGNLVIDLGEEPEFRYRGPCDLCESMLGGDFHEVEIETR